MPVVLFRCCLPVPARFRVVVPVMRIGRSADADAYGTCECDDYNNADHETQTRGNAAHPASCSKKISRNHFLISLYYCPWDFLFSSQAFP
jgi:hypothetical protein